MLPRSPLLRDYQARVLLALLHGLAHEPGVTLTVMFPRQSGKNEVSAALVASLLMTHARRGGTVIVCAPTFEPQARISQERTWRALSFVAPLVPSAGRPRREGASILLGRARATFLSASPNAHIAGHTASLALIADEAQEIDTDWFDRQFRPMAASTGAGTVLFGTPWDGRSLLERAVAANRAHDASLPGRPYRDFVPRHHEVHWEDVAASRRRYGEYVRAERERLGPSHPLYLSQYELVASEAAGRLFDEAALAGITGVHPIESTPSPGQIYVAGLDFGGEGAGADATVLTIARMRGEAAADVVAIRAWRGAPFSLVEGEVVAATRRWGLAVLVCDATGLGGPLAASLERSLGPIVRPFVFTAASKSALGYALLAAAKTGRVRLPAPHEPDLRRAYAELSSCRAEFGAGRALQWGSSRGDDYVVSLALCVHAMTLVGGPRVALGRARG